MINKIKMTKSIIPTIQSDHVSTFFLFIVMTGMFVLLMVSIGKSFEFFKKPLDSEPAIIKTFTTTYLLVFNEVLLIYIYFIFLCFILKDNSILGGIVKFLFVAVTIGASFIVMGYASDALKKIKELPNVGDYNEYTDLLNKLVMVSVVLIVLSFFWIFLRFRASRIERQKRQSLKALHQVATTGINVRSATATTQQKQNKQQNKKT